MNATGGFNTDDEDEETDNFRLTTQENEEISTINQRLSTHESSAVL